VAKRSTSKALVPKHIEAKTTSAIAGMDFYHPILLDCNLDWSPAESVDSRENQNTKPLRFYDTALRYIEASEKNISTIATCAFSAGQKIEDKKILEARCTYMIGVKHGGGHSILSKADRKKLLEEIAATAAWPLFRALFAQMVAQTIVELPLLPNIPKLRWIKASETAKGAEGN
jgi:hypothetical protein